MREHGAKKLQGEQTRARIEAEAARLFSSQGFTRTPISAIAGALGLTKGALYAHFASKDELLLSLMARFESSYLDALVAEVGAARGSAADRLHRLVSFSSRFAEEDPDLCMLLVIASTELQGAGDALAAELRRIYDRYTQLIAELIRDGQEEGDFDRSHGTAALARVVIALLDGVLLGWRRYGRYGVDGAELVRTFRKVLLGGLEPRLPAAAPEGAGRPHPTPTPTQGA